MGKLRGMVLLCITLLVHLSWRIQIITGYTEENKRGDVYFISYDEIVDFLVTKRSGSIPGGTDDFTSQCRIFQMSSKKVRLVLRYLREIKLLGPKSTKTLNSVKW